MDQERRIVEVPVTRYPHGNVDNYELLLRDERLLVTVADERRGFSAHFGGGSLEVEKDDSGHVTGLRVRVGEITSWDLNGNGQIEGSTGPGY